MMGSMESILVCFVCLFLNIHIWLEFSIQETLFLMLKIDQGTFHEFFQMVPEQLGFVGQMALKPCLLS